MPSANEQILDELLRHEIGLRRFSNATLYKVVALLNRVDGRLTAELAKRDPGGGGFTQKRLELLLDAVRLIMKEAYNSVTGTFDDEARALSAYEAQFQGDLFKRTIPVAVDIVMPASAQVYAAVHSRPFQGRLLREYYGDLEPAAFKRVRDAIRMGYLEGRTTDQIIRDIRGTRAEKYRNGILEINRRSAEMMVRTALAHTATTARGEVFKQNANVIKGVKWVSTLDGRTCFVAGTMVETPTGPKPIEKIGKGEIVVGGSGRPRKVEGVASSHKTQLARVTLSNGQTVVCTVDHLFRMKDGCWKESKDLMVGDSLATVL